MACASYNYHSHKWGYLGIAVVAMLVYALLRAAYAVFQIYQASCAFEIRSQKLITELDTSVVQDYNVASITEILPQFDLVYDADGNWLDSIIESPGQWQDKISADRMDQSSGRTILPLYR